MAGVLKGLPGVDTVEVVDNKIVVSVEDPEKQNPTLVKALVENGAEIQFVGELRRRLEDVYLELMGSAQGNSHEQN